LAKKPFGQNNILLKNHLAAIEQFGQQNNLLKII
jgi:hypothetical protein